MKYLTGNSCCLSLLIWCVFSFCTGKFRKALQTLAQCRYFRALSCWAIHSWENRSEVNMLLKPFWFFSSAFQFPTYAILIACLLVVSLVFMLTVSLLCKRKYPWVRNGFMFLMLACCRCPSVPLVNLLVYLPWPPGQNSVNFTGLAVLTPGLCHREDTRELELVRMQQEEACAKNLFTHLLQVWLILLSLTLQ